MALVCRRRVVPGLLGAQGEFGGALVSLLGVAAFGLDGAGGLGAFAQGGPEGGQGDVERGQGLAYGGESGAVGGQAEIGRGPAEFMRRPVRPAAPSR